MPLIAIMVIRKALADDLSTDIECCTIVNEDSLESTLEEFKPLVDKLDGAELIYCEATPQVMNLQHLEEQLAEQEAVEDEVYCTGCTREWGDCECSPPRQLIKRAHRPKRAR